MKKCYLLTGFVFLFVLHAIADTFIVTSNADSGPNTLRKAISDAGANGTATQDIIIFQFADLSRAGRTIDLLSELPKLSSNLVIDGSTQPGTNFGVSDAKVILQRTAPVGAAGFIFLQFEQVANVEIYGLYLFNKWWDDDPFLLATVSGVVFSAAKNIKIGGVGKGNYIRGTLTAAIMSQSTNTAAYSDSIYVQGNIIGIDETGGITNNAPVSEKVFNGGHGMLLRNVYNVWIGGDNVQEGNTMFCGRNDFLTDKLTGCGTLKIANNKFNVDINGNLDLDGTSGNEMGFGISGPPAKSDFTLYYLNNIHNGSLGVYRLSQPFVIQGNKIFGWQFNTTVPTKLTISSCDGGLIGGDLPTERNEIYTSNPNSNYYGVFTPENQRGITNFYSPNVTIKKNSIYCTAYFGSSIAHDQINPSIFPVPYVRIDSTGTNFVRGKATPNSTVEVFLDDDCLACEGKTYLGSTTSNADSTWSFTGTFNTVIVATATNVQGTTSEFSAPELITTAITTRRPSCGQKNGYIKGMQAKGYDRVEWRHRYNPSSYADSLVSTQLDAYNLASGQYYFHAWLGNSCRSYFWRVDVGPDITPRLDTSAKHVTHPSCGQAGAIKNIKVTGADYSTIYWKSSNGQIIQPTINGQFVSLLDASPGTYKLIVEDTYGGCGDSTFWYTLTNQTGPYLNLDNMQITHATCSNSNGSITNIVVHDAIGSVYYRWEDSTGTVIGNSLNLNNVKGGKYRLKFKDGSNCDTIKTAFLIVQAVGLITIDTSNVKITPSCTQAGNGRITGLSVMGASNYQWINTSSSTVVGNTVDLLQVPPGNYQLRASNTVGCSVASPVFTVLNNVFPASLGFTSFTIKPATCNLNNGELIVAPNATTAQYSFEWIDSTIGSFYSNSKDIADLAAGTYEYHIVDVNGCRKMVSRFTVVQTGVPTIVDASLVTTVDTCNIGLGKASLQIMGAGASYSWEWVNSTGTWTVPASTGNPGVGSTMKAGSYYAIAKDEWNCSDTSQLFSIGNTSRKVDDPIANDSYIPRGTAATIIIKNHQSYNWQEYSLFDTLPANNAVQAHNKTGTFVTYPVMYSKQFYVQSLHGTCSSGLTPVYVEVFNQSDIIVPNAFSPNGDGINDELVLKMEGLVSSIVFSVYNRNGQQVFSTNNINNRFNGFKNGKPLPVGTYYWILQARDHNNSIIKKGGYIALIK